MCNAINFTFVNLTVIMSRRFLWDSIRNLCYTRGTMPLCVQSAINSGRKYRTVSRTFTDKVPLVARTHTRRVCVYTHLCMRERVHVFTSVHGARVWRGKRETTEEQLERRTKRRGKEEEERKTGGK